MIQICCGLDRATDRCCIIAHAMQSSKLSWASHPHIHTHTHVHTLSKEFAKQEEAAESVPRDGCKVRHDRQVDYRQRAKGKRRGPMELLDPKRDLPQMPQSSNSGKVRAEEGT